MSYTNVPKPTDATYVKVSKDEVEAYDESSASYDDSTVTYDG